MTPDGLREVIDAGESLDVEFKGESHQPLSDADLLEAVVCLANRPGQAPGLLLVGVEDDGRVTGARARHESGHTDPLRVQALIANRTRPALTVRATLMAVKEGPVLVVEVPASRSPVGTTDGRYVRRALGGDGRPVCLPYHFHEMLAHQADRGILDYSALVLAGIAWQDLDRLEFERFRRSVRENRGQSDEALLELSDLELAKALGAVENGELPAVRVLGLLLFGAEEMIRRALPTHEVAFQVLADTEVEVNDFFRWPLLRVFEEIDVRFRARRKEEEIFVGMRRIGIPNYSERAFREGVANALIHRDYIRLGAVHVQWHQDHIEISNPGGFPEGVRLENLLATQPRPRNPLLADAFKRAGLVEKTARGIDTIFFEQLRNGRPVPSYERSTEVGVVLVLPGGKADLGFARFVAEEGEAGRPLALDDLLLLSSLRAAHRMTIAEAAAVLQKPAREARDRLDHLVEAGLVGAIGTREEHRYVLRRPPLAVVVGGTGRLEIIDLRDRILKYLEAHGRITRGEAAELCQIGPQQATRLLRRLVQSGSIQRRGEGRTAWYEVAP